MKEKYLGIFWWKWYLYLMIGVNTVTLYFVIRNNDSIFLILYTMILAILPIIILYGIYKKFMIGYYLSFLFVIFSIINLWIQYNIIGKFTINYFIRNIIFIIMVFIIYSERKYFMVRKVYK